MSTGAIKAGGAVVEISISDKIGAGLDRIQRRLNGWAQSLAITGAALGGAGAGILMPILSAVQSFIDSGSALADMSARTGVSAEALSELGYAAKQTGTDLGALEIGLRKMAQFEHKLAEGNKGAAKILAELGIGAAQFRDASTTEQLAMLADGLSRIEDPSQRAALAMATLGKSGTALLPMLAGGSAGLNELVNKARELNIVISDEQAAKADALGDSWDNLRAVWSAIAFKSGAALADSLMAIIEMVIEGSKAVGDFIQNNQQLVIITAATGAGLIALGAILGATSLGLYATSTAIGVITTILVVAKAAVLGIVAALGLIFTPIGAIVAILATATVGWAMFTTAGQSSMKHISDGFWSLLDSGKKALGGITDALINGNWSLAGKIAMSFLNVAWIEGTGRLRQIWLEFTNFVMDSTLRLAEFQVRNLNKLFRSDLLKNLEKEIKDVRVGFGIQKDESVAKVQAEITKAKTDLEKLTTQASAERKAKEDERLSRAKKRFDTDLVPNLPTDIHNTGPNGATFGTFSSHMVGLLGRMSPDISHAKKTADNTEAMKESLEAIQRKIEEDEGTVFE